MLQTFFELESEVRYYSRAFPTVFTKASQSYMYDTNGKRYIDFFSGAGALNYGHNEKNMKKRLMDYMNDDGIVHALDMATVAKEEFLHEFKRIILQPRHYDYKMQFTGPAGTNAVEAALKLARKYTGRKNVVYFTDAFHGMSMGALSVAGNPKKRKSAGIPLDYTVEIPFADKEGSLEAFLEFIYNCSPDDLPAALIIEPIQADGGINVASDDWLREVFSLAKEKGIITIADDIQVGCGRTGSFFSFENAGIEPDVVCLSKSLSGFGLPLSILLLNPEIDCWEVGEHNGTFRGISLAFISAVEALKFWERDDFIKGLQKRIDIVDRFLEKNFRPMGLTLKGRGMIRGIELYSTEQAKAAAEAAFEQGLIIENCGREDTVMKLLPALNIPLADLEEGLNVLAKAIHSVC